MAFTDRDDENDSWTIKTASAQFSRLFAAAMNVPQIVSRRQIDRVVVLNEEEYVEMKSAPHDLYSVVCSMKPIQGLCNDLGERRRFPSRRISLS